ncbi:hypothetical protein CTA2_1286 [Colletotrichum tanaceti]|nr:hypothetical protein CTA2_1286 [Colletotrichum tanaceti]
MSKQDNNAPSLIHQNMQLPSLCAFLSIPDSAPPWSMTSSTQMLGFSRPEGGFQRTVMCCQRGMQSSAPSSTSTHQLCRLFLSFGGARSRSQAAPTCPLRLLLPLPLGLTHKSLVEMAD